MRFYFFLRDSEPVRLRCNNQTYHCDSQKEAEERCAEEGLILCDFDQIRNSENFRPCTIMWISDFDDQGCYIGLGTNQCGALDREICRTESYNGPLKFDAACCVEQSKNLRNILHKVLSLLKCYKSSFILVLHTKEFPQF